MSEMSEDLENKAKAKRPAPPHAWKPGQSGNPGGRPRVNHDIVALARQYTEEALQALHDALKDPRSKVAAAQALLDRGYGRAIQRQEHTGADGGPIQTQQIADDRLPVDSFLAEFSVKADKTAQH